MIGKDARIGNSSCDQIKKYRSLARYMNGLQTKGQHPIYVLICQLNMIIYACMHVYVLGTNDCHLVLAPLFSISPQMDGGISPSII